MTDHDLAWAGFWIGLGIAVCGLAVANGLYSLGQWIRATWSNK